MKTVSIGLMPGSIRQVEVPDDAVVNDVVSAAGLDPNGHDIRIAGRVVELGSAVNGGDTVLLVRKVKGNILVRALRRLFGI